MKAMLANKWDSRVSIQDYIANDRYVMEQKLDGHRILIEVSQGKVAEVYERNGRRSQHYLRISSDEWNMNFRRLASRRFIMDGEFISGVLHVFDLPFLEGMISPQNPQQERKNVLDQLFETNEFYSQLKLVETARTPRDKTRLLVNCHKGGAEGVMIKECSAPYVPGYTKNMLKVKFTKSADFVVMETRIDGKENVALGLYDDAGRLVEVGKCRLIGDETIKINDVLEVRYLFVSDDMRLVQPHMKFKREDKDPTTCLLSQLKPSDTKTVVTL